MASYKVEICGVNTSTLPILKESEKKDLFVPVSYTHLRAHETDSYLVCRLLLEKKKKKKTNLSLIQNRKNKKRETVS